MLTHSWLLLALTVTAPMEDEVLALRAKELVAKLGDPSFRVREKAAAELLQIGYPARDAVVAGQKSGDLEVSERCKKLYPIIWQRDLDRRIAKFLAATDGSVPNDLPAAKAWFDLTGDSKESRALYATLVRAHSETMLKLELHPEQARQQYIDFVRNHFQKNVAGAFPSTTSRTTHSDADVLMFLLLGASTGVRTSGIVAGTSSSYFYQFLNSVFLQEQLPNNPALRKLFAGWLANERYSLTFRRGLDLAGQHKVRECIPAIVKIAKDNNTMITLRAMATLGFARIGTKDDLKELQPLLEEKTVVTPAVIVVGNERGSVQIRDVAMAAAVQAMGLNLSDFGFERKPPAGLVTTTYTYYAFTTDEKREAAHKKWAEWAKANIKK